MATGFFETLESFEMIDFKTEILAPVAEDFQALDAFIAHGVHSKVPLVMAVSRHVVEAGGKRLRPLMCLLAGRACAPEQPRPDSMVKLAALVEMLHTATLVHDDVVDASGLRRGVPTAHVTWDNPTAVLVGDFLIARAFHLMVGLGQMDLLEDFSAGTCEIAEGEVLQLQHQHHPDASEADYLQIIYGKTSRLFMMACEGAAMLAGQPQYREGLRAFAAHFGNAFQIIDDILDYSSDAETLGKNIGDDLMEGKPTLPLIAALQRTDGADRELLRIHRAIAQALGRAERRAKRRVHSVHPHVDGAALAVASLEDRDDVRLHVGSWLRAARRGAP